MRHPPASGPGRIGPACRSRFSRLPPRPLPGHDENISFDEMVARIGGPLAEQLRAISMDLYRRAADFAEPRGIILADTKFEFGLDR